MNKKLKTKPILTNLKDIDGCLNLDTNNSKDVKLLNKIVKQLKDTMVEHKDLLCLAAPQIGYNYRVFCMNFNGDIRAFINPMIIKQTGLHLSRETCPSIPDKTYIIPRNDTIVACYSKPNLTVETNKFIGAAAEVFQQCVDLVNGVLLSDLGLEIDKDFDEATEEERQELLDYYINYLKLQNLSNIIYIKNNPNSELALLTKDINELTRIAKGEIVVSPIESSKIEKKKEEDTVYKA